MVDKHLYNALMPPIKFWHNRTWFESRCQMRNFKMAAIEAILDIGSEQF